MSRHQNRTQRPAAPRRAAAAAPRWARRAWLVVVGGVVLLGLLGGFAWWGWHGQQDARQTGDATRCRKLPGFTQPLVAQGFGTVSLSTAERDTVGLLALDATAERDAEGRVPAAKRWQHPTWQDAGYLGPTVIDADGNVYAAPVPRIAMRDNPVARAMTLWRAASQSGVMQPYLTLPRTQPIRAENPFGMLGLAYDCVTDSIYASVVGDSDPRGVDAGTVVRIDRKQGTVQASYELGDAVGLLVETLPGERVARLYYGPARSSEVRSVPLDARGNVSGPSRREAVLDGGKARKIALTVAADGTASLSVASVYFAYSLSVSADATDLQTQLRFVQRPAGWVRVPE